MKKISTRMLVCILTVVMLCSILTISVFAGSSSNYFSYNLGLNETARFGSNGTAYTSVIAPRNSKYADLTIEASAGNAYFWVADIYGSLVTWPIKVGPVQNNSYKLYYITDVNYRKLQLRVNNGVDHNNVISGWWNP